MKNLEWDDQLPCELATEWLEIRENLPKINRIKIERHILTNSKTKVALHGFSDASKHAYSAVVYGKIVTPNGNSIIRLLTSKTKVAPLKQISIPRLELCGALLLSKLLVSVKQTLNTEITEITAWTDSTIVLDWLSAIPSKWNTFVGNRTGEILTTMNRSQWRHVDSKDNPADCASRGIEPEKLPDFSLWWNGPKWLVDSKNWPINVASNLNTTEEMRSQSMSIQIPETSLLDQLIEQNSSFNKMIRILAYTIRFINLSSKRVLKNSILPYLQTSELQKPRYLIFQFIQRKHFESEIKLIMANKDLPNSSKLRYLKPYLDESGLLRVGGRIVNASGLCRSLSNVHD